MRLKDNTKSKVILVNCWVAFLQLFTTIFFLLGWIWSIVWGTLFLSYTGTVLIVDLLYKYDFYYSLYLYRCFLTTLANNFVTLNAFDCLLFYVPLDMITSPLSARCLMVFEQRRVLIVPHLYTGPWISFVISSEGLSHCLLRQTRCA
jgi:hypothetical protein